MATPLAVVSDVSLGYWHNTVNLSSNRFVMDRISVGTQCGVRAYLDLTAIDWGNAAPGDDGLEVTEIVT